jgi:hypothetical protein
VASAAAVASPWIRLVIFLSPAWPGIVPEAFV